MKDHALQVGLLWWLSRGLKYNGAEGRFKHKLANKQKQDNSRSATTKDQVFAFLLLCEE